jgi:hypothetical protein
MPSNIGAKRHNVLSKEMKLFLESFFKKGPWPDLFLTGGTALAEYYLGHRTSIDIDLFTSSADSFRSASDMIRDPTSWKNFTIKINRSFPRFVGASIIFSGATEPIKLDLVHDIPARVKPYTTIDGISVDSFEDIAANKIGCLISRKELKDFIDIYFMNTVSPFPISKWVELGKLKDGGLAPFIVSSCIDWIFEVKETPKYLIKTLHWKEFHQFWKKFQTDLMALEPRPS